MADKLQTAFALDDCREDGVDDDLFAASDAEWVVNLLAVLPMWDMLKLTFPILNLYS